MLLRSGKWLGRYFEDSTERRVRRSVFLGFATELSKTQAKRKLMNLIADAGLNQSEYLNQAVGSAQPFSDVVNQWKKVRLPKLSKSSQYMAPKLIERHLIPFFGEMQIGSIRTAHINEWIAVAMEGKAPKTVLNMYKQLRAIISWHFKQFDQHPPKWSPDLPKLKDAEQRWFGPNEARLIAQAASGQYCVLFHLAYATGMRFGELAGLHVEDVDLARRVITVKRSVWRGREVPTKTRSGQREIVLDDETARILKVHLATRQNNRVFSTRNGTPLANREVVFDVLYPICDKLGIKHGGMHAFRHGRVSLMRVSGAPDDVVTRQIGHSALRITSNYTHFSADYLRDLANKLAGVTLNDSGVQLNSRLVN